MGIEPTLDLIDPTTALKTAASPVMTRVYNPTCLQYAKTAKTTPNCKA